MNYSIKVVCCECGKDLGSKDVGQKPDMVSHSYCEPCKRKVMEEIADYGKNEG